MTPKLTCSSWFARGVRLPDRLKSLQVSPSSLAMRGISWASRSSGPPKSSPKKSSPRPTPNRPGCYKEYPSTQQYEPTPMAHRQGDPGACLQTHIPGPFSQAKRLFLVGPGGIHLVQSSSTFGAPPHFITFPGGSHPPMCASAASAWDSQKGISMARYSSMAAVSSAQACSCRPTLLYRVPRP
jgi:hypothetical protein